MCKYGVWKRLAIMWIIQVWQIVYHWSNSHLRVEVLHNSHCFIFALIHIQDEIEFCFPANAFVVLLSLSSQNVSRQCLLVVMHSQYLSIYINLYTTIVYATNVCCTMLKSKRVMYRILRVREHHSHSHSFERCRK